MKMLLRLSFSILLAIFFCSEIAFAQLASKRNRSTNYNVQRFGYSIESSQKIKIRPSFDITELCKALDFKNINLDSAGQMLIAEIQVKIDTLGNVLQSSKVFKTMYKDANSSPEWTEAVLKAIKQVKFTPSQTEDGAITSMVSIVVRHDANRLCF